MEMIPEDRGFTLKYDGKEGQESTSVPHVASKLLKDAVIKNFENDLKKLQSSFPTMLQHSSTPTKHVIITGKQ